MSTVLKIRRKPRSLPTRRPWMIFCSHRPSLKNGIIYICRQIISTRATIPLAISAIRKKQTSLLPMVMWEWKRWFQDRSTDICRIKTSASYDRRFYSFREPWRALLRQCPDFEMGSDEALPSINLRPDLFPNHPADFLRPCFKRFGVAAFEQQSRLGFRARIAQQHASAG